MASRKTCFDLVLSFLQLYLSRCSLFAGLWLLLAVLSPMLTGFATFHCYMACNGRTTNEISKWANVAEMVRDGEVTKCIEYDDESEAGTPSSDENSTIRRRAPPSSAKPR